MQYAAEKPAEPLEVRIYPGADGEFTLYEDENDNYNYEHGVYATIRFEWQEQAKKLIMEERKGSFPGMPVKRTINIVLVTAGHGTDIDSIKTPDKSVLYDGSRMELQF